jgi:hypothetical protein
MKGYATVLLYHPQCIHIQKPQTAFPGFHLSRLEVAVCAAGKVEGLIYTLLILQVNSAKQQTIRESNPVQKEVASHVISLYLPHVLTPITMHNMTTYSIPLKVLKSEILKPNFTKKTPIRNLFFISLQFKLAQTTTKISKLFHSHSKCPTTRSQTHSGGTM